MVMASRVRLQPVDPESSIEHQELVRQRRLCGWGEDNIPTWLDMVRKSDRVMWWIMSNEALSKDVNDEEEVEEKHNFILPDKSNLLLPPRDPYFRPIGHLALDHVSYQKDPSLADRATHTMTISTFFIVLSKQGKGLGRDAMDMAEAVAKEEHGCRVLTLNTLAAWVSKDEKWRKENDMTRPDATEKGLQNEEWYLRRGYKVYREQPMYPWEKKDGTIVKLPAVFMRKSL